MSTVSTVSTRRAVPGDGLAPRPAEQLIGTGIGLSRPMLTTSAPTTVSDLRDPRVGERADRVVDAPSTTVPAA